MEAGNLYGSVVAFIEEHRLICPGDKVVVAYSGGLDSGSLLHLLWRFSLERAVEVVAAMVDHGLRNFEEEVEVGGGFARQLGLDFVFYALPGGLRDRARKHGLSLEHAARHERYAALRAVAADCGAQRVALAHHASDQAETMLMRLARGTGPRGLAAMSPISQGLFIRPLLLSTMSEVERYAKLRDVPSVEDPTNASDEFLRNRFRKRVLPAIEQVQPGAVRVMARSSLVMSDDAAAVRQLADERLEGVAQWATGTVTLPLSILAAGPLRRLLLHRIFERLLDYPPDSLHIRRVDSFLNDSGSPAHIELPGAVRLERRYDEITVRTVPRHEPVNFDISMPDTGRFDTPGGTLVVTFIRRWDGELPSDENSALLAHEPAMWPLRARSRREGERMQPRGMNGTRKLSDIFIDARTPRHMRTEVPIVTDCQGRIVWVVGLRRSAVVPAVPGEPAWQLAWEPLQKRQRP
jgi:tRNA(Ile)-lysidine synthase